MFFHLSASQIGYILEGTGWSFLLSVIGTVGGFIVGLPIALARVSKRRWVRSVSGIYVQFNQGIPLPVTMFMVYFGISIFGVNVSTVLAASSALVINASAYLGEMWKGSINSVALTQSEAAESLALTYVQRMIYVILPQAVTIAIPPTVGFVVGLIKNTSYAVVIGMAELTYSARVVNNTTFEPFVIFTLAAAIYFLMCYPLSRLSLRLERAMRKV
ncbi:MAG: polar amino acid transport system permease protein [Paraburkholderia sp.]|jgi:polar amino acid transport system permease protein|uniref:amino acid ABC transporter permease n=1 Tax=Paraburkholderia sp. TaxID=1926495 RepID=UPI002B002008|nr:amino acid ABC transporter permease [Paraburkholderia sp.]MEA3085630.1 polar amino acid transport system permease protein [Paraburkholderia sp.]